MGMFNYIINASAVGEFPANTVFQTKSIDPNVLDVYLITSDGRLMCMSQYSPDMTTCTPTLDPSSYTWCVTNFTGTVDYYCEGKSGNLEYFEAEFLNGNPKPAATAVVEVAEQVQPYDPFDL